MFVVNQHEVLEATPFISQEDILPTFCELRNMSTIS